MIRSIIWTTILCIIAAILQSTLVSYVSFFKAVPDLALCILVFSAYVNGTMTGQTSGFLSGVFIGFLSQAPLGMDCLVRTLIGALTGIFKGAFFLDIIFLPVILCGLATLLKGFIVLILSLIMGPDIDVRAYPINSSLLWLELALNCLCAPFLFMLLKRCNFLLVGRN